MKVLLLSNTAGQGHRSTAAALMDTLGSMGAECRVLDSYEYISPVLYQTIARGYLLATSVTPSAYGRFYRLAETRDQNNSKHSVANVANSIMAIKLKKYFEQEFNPDVIICTHVFSAQIINAMKAYGQTDAVAIGIVTDYTIHPFWQDVTYMDYIVTASDLLTYQAVKKGIRPERILPLGIPVSPKFSERVPQEDARRQLGLDPALFTILLMSGSMGHGNFYKVLRRIDGLDRQFQVLAVCGNNAHAKRKIDHVKLRHKVHTYGFVHNVDRMMDAADCIITKPGGLTASEALAKDLPILMINPIPGQEDRNVEFMLNNGLAMNVTDTFPLDEALYELFLYPEKLRNMVRNIQLVGKPHATRDLCGFVMKLGKK